MLSQCLRAALIAVFTAATACTVQLVAPYNSELEQKASSMEAEVSSWDLAMRQGAGRIDDDPRNPDNVKMLNKWRGEADAMLTLIVSSDPDLVNCSEVAQKVYKTLEDQLPQQVRANVQKTTDGATQTSGARAGCEAAVVADLNSAIDDAADKLKYCKLDWVKDDYFAGASHAAATAAPPPPASSDAQEKINRSCLAEFRETPPAGSSPGTRHGRAVSHLLTTLQVIVYVENRKKAAASK